MNLQLSTLNFKLSTFFIDENFFKETNSLRNEIINLQL